MNNSDHLIIDGWPGTKAPHIWMNKEKSFSILDKFGDKFILLTTNENISSIQAALIANEALSIPFVMICLTKQYDNPKIVDDFLACYQLESNGAVIVRPDGFIGWRSKDSIPETSEEWMNIFKPLISLKS